VRRRRGVVPRNARPPADGRRPVIAQALIRRPRVLFLAEATRVLGNEAQSVGAASARAAPALRAAPAPSSPDGCPRSWTPTG
jgi:hypothetical protein